MRVWGFLLCAGAFFFLGAQRDRIRVWVGETSS